jgi:hypothetical protein
MNVKGMSLEKLLSEEARLMSLLGSGTNVAAETEDLTSHVELELIHDIPESAEVQTVLLDNRVGIVSNYTPGLKPVLVTKEDFPEFANLMGQYTSALAEATIADTQAIESQMKADAARRSLNGFVGRLASVEKEVLEARKLVEAALARLNKAEESKAVLDTEYANAQKPVIETVRLAKEMVSKADAASFKAMMFAAKASKILLDGEVDAVEKAFAGANRNLQTFSSCSFSSIEEIDDAENKMHLPYAFKQFSSKTDRGGME